MPGPLEVVVNGVAHRVEATPDTPLLYVLRNECNLIGPRFGCGLAQCGACTVHLDGASVRSCVLPVSSAAGRQVTTLEGLAATYPTAKSAASVKAEPVTMHPVQKAFVAEEAAQCGYCINGWVMTAAALLKEKPQASDAEIRTGLSGLKCRCGAHMSILRAVKRAAKDMA